MAIDDPRDPNTRWSLPNRGRGTRSWLWLIIAIVVLVAWFAHWGSHGWFGHTRGPSVAHTGSPTGSPTLNLPNSNPDTHNSSDMADWEKDNRPDATGHGSVDADEVLNSNNKIAMVGQQVTLHDVQVQHEVTKDVLWIGKNASNPTLLVVTGNEANTQNVAQGDRIDVTATVEKAPSAKEARHTWRLSNHGAQQLEQQKAYLRATGYTVQPHS